MTLNLDTRLYQPYRKPNDQTRYVHAQSNHPPAITNNLPKSIEQRYSKNSSNKEVFEKAAPYYQQALQDSGYTQQIEYQEERPKRKRNRKRTITWFNPPFSKNVKTDIARRFLKMLDKHFPKKSKLHKIFNRSTVKVSYSTMPNVEKTMDLMSGNRLNNSYTYSENVLFLSGVTKNRLYRVSIEDSDFIPTNIFSKSSTVLLFFGNHPLNQNIRDYDQPQDKYHIPPAEDNHGLKMLVFV